MIALYGNSKQGDNLAKLGRLFDMIEERGKEIVVYHRFANYLTEHQLWRPSMKESLGAVATDSAEVGSHGQVGDC